MTDLVGFQAVHLRLLFLEREDRLLLLAMDQKGAQEGLVLTRRLTARLINGLAKLLENSNVAASTAPEELKDDIVLMEHQGALASTQAVPVSGDTTPQVQQRGATLRVPQRLVETVNIKTNPRDFHIVLQAESSVPVATVLNRLDLHRFVELLKRQAVDAGWNLPIDAAWLGEDHPQITLN